MSFRLAVDWMGNGLLNTMKQHIVWKPQMQRVGLHCAALKKKKKKT